MVEGVARAVNMIAYFVGHTFVECKFGKRCLRFGQFNLKVNTISLLLSPL